MMILSICDEPTILEVIDKILFFIDIIKVVVPIALILVIMIKFLSALTSHDADLLQKALKNSVSNAIAAVLVFLIPTFVSIVANISMDNLNASSCFTRHSYSEIAILYYDKADKLVSAAESSETRKDYSAAVSYLKNIKDEDKKEELMSRLNVVLEKIEEREKKERESHATTPSSSYSGNYAIVELAKKYIGKNVGTDCSGFVKNVVLKPLGYLQSDIKNVAKSCDGRARGSNGMYYKYMEKGQVVWQRPASDINLPTSIRTFPGECKPGDLIFYSYGANDCVKHVVIYAGFENGHHMIVDSNMQDNIVRYRAIDAIYRTAMPLGCARALKSEE